MHEAEEDEDVRLDLEGDVRVPPEVVHPRRDARDGLGEVRGVAEPSVLWRR